MEKDWRTMMDVGLVHFMAFPIIKDEDARPILDSAAQIAADDFFDVLEVRRSEQPGVAEGLKRIAGASGLLIGVGAQPGLLLNKLSLNDPDDAGRRAAIDEVKQSIDFAAALDAPMVALLSGPDPGDAERENQLELLVGSLVELCRYGQEKGGDEPIWISLEQFDRKYDKKSLVGPSDVAVRVAYMVKDQAENFGLCVDLSHIPLLEESIEDCLFELKDHLIHVHAGNCIMRDPGLDGYGDKHPRFGHPDGENGVAELQKYLETLVYIGYFQNPVPTRKPVFTFEVAPMEGETPDLIIANTKRTFREAWSGA